MAEGFRLGDFTFLLPGERAPLDRRGMRPRRPLRGADPPGWLQGCVRESVGEGAAALLWGGDFCGHGEPAYSVFDIVIDGQEVVEVCVAEEPAARDTVLFVRPSSRGGSWTIVYAKWWFAGGKPPPSPERLEAEMGEPMAGPKGKTRLRAAIAFEYPIECTSPNDVSWVTVAIQEEGAAESFVGLDEETS